MIFKKDKEIETASFWDDLFEGGYINPHELLVHEVSAIKVCEAMETLERFKASAYEQGVIIDL